MTTTKNIYQRMHAVMKAVEYVQKEEKKNGIQYRFVSHDAVTGAVRPHLVENGVIYFPQNLVTSCDGNRTEVHFDLRFVNVDTPTDFIDVPTFGYGIDSQDKGPGKAISYGVKYALLKALGLETGDDPEKDNIDHEPATKTPKPSKPALSQEEEKFRAWLSGIKGALDNLQTEDEFKKWYADNGTNIAKMNLKQIEWFNGLIGPCSDRLKTGV